MYFDNNSKWADRNFTNTYLIKAEGKIFSEEAKKIYDIYTRAPSAKGEDKIDYGTRLSLKDISLWIAVCYDLVGAAKHPAFKLARERQDKVGEGSLY